MTVEGAATGLAAPPRSRPGRLLWLAAAASLVLVAALGWAGLLFAGHVPWPFPWRPSLVALDDPDLRREVGLATLALAAALFASGLGAAVRPLRWAGPAGALVLAVAALPHLRYLLVEAYPTSYVRSPTGFASATIVHGRGLYKAACASCHGIDGRGDGPLARTLDDPPADLTAAHLWDHGDGELFWWLTHGIDGPEGGLVMPGFAGTLSVADRWALIDYVRAHNAGAAMQWRDGWPRPVPVPGFVARCAAGSPVASDALRGRVVRLIVGGGGGRPAPLPETLAGVGLLDVYAAAKPEGSTGCVAEAPALMQALATVTGSTPGALTGDEFLVDPQGFLRSWHRAGRSDGWSDTVSLLAQVGRICTHPVASGRGDDGQAE